MYFDNNIINKIGDYVDNKSLINLSLCNKNNYNLLSNHRECMYERLWKENDLEDVNPNARKYKTRKSILFKYIYKLCKECYNTFGYKTLFGTYICSKCNELDKYKLIKQYEVQNDYKLPICDIRELKIKFNYGSASYYNVKEIKEYIYNKYNISYNIYIENILKKEKEKALRKEEIKKNKINKRIKKIDKYIEEYYKDKVIDKKIYDLFIKDLKLSIEWFDEAINRNEDVIKVIKELNISHNKYIDIINNYIINNTNHYDKICNKTTTY